MANDFADTIGGTVIERAFVGIKVPAIIHVATVPLAEIGYSTPSQDDTNFLRGVVADLFGLPQASIIDEAQFRALSIIVRDDPHRLLDRRRPYHFMFEMFEEWVHHASRTGSELVSTGNPVFALAQASIGLFARSGSPIGDVWPWPWPFLGSFSEIAADIDNRTNAPFDENGVAMGLRCLWPGMNEIPSFRSFRESLLQYDIPLGQSPKTQSDSLRTLIEGGKKMCLAPVAAGASVGVGFLGQGQFVSALLCTGTGAMMTLILLGTLSLGSVLVRRVAQTRQQQRRTKGSPAVESQSAEPS
jgi:hypothetical protein